jgi:hypothetical protein
MEIALIWLVQSITMMIREGSLSKPTITPWRIVDTVYGPLSINSTDPDIRKIICEFTYDHADDKANAELIVKCVNNWEGAVELIENLKTALVNGCETEEDKDGLLELTYAFLQKAKATL